MSTLERRSRGLAAVLAATGFVLFANAAGAYAYQEIEVTDGGSISGTVTVTGEVPEQKPLKVIKDHEVCGNEVPNESLVVGSNKGVRYAVVTIENISKGRASEVGEVHPLDNKQCVFSPHVQAASVGQWLVLKNTDSILHTADAILGGNTLFNVGLWPGREVRRPISYAGIVHINCGVHPWMNAYVVVTDHPYHAVTDIYGDYQIDEVPPGTYKLRVWHELLGTAEKEVRVSPRASSKLDFVLGAGRSEPRTMQEMPQRPPGKTLLAAGLALPTAVSAAPARAAAQPYGAVTGFLTVQGKTDPRVANTVVWVEGVPHEKIPADKWNPSKLPRMDQRNIRFDPYVLPVVVGTTVDFPNDDPVFHNVYSDSTVHKFDLGLYPKGSSRSTTFDKPGIVEIGCNTHAQMKAYVVVVPEPYFAVPNEREVYQLKDLPLGKYVIKVWNPDFPPITEPFTLEKDGQVLNLDFDLGGEQ